jgi:hypothetical protein
LPVGRGRSGNGRSGAWSGRLLIATDISVICMPRRLCNEADTSFVMFIGYGWNTKWESVVQSAYGPS